MSTIKDPSHNLRENLRKFRELRGMTQAQMSFKSSVGSASISHFETGQRTPTIATLVKLADALDVTVDALLGRAPIETSANVDPIFQQASRANAQTLETVRRITAAILEDENYPIPMKGRD